MRRVLLALLLVGCGQSAPPKPEPPAPAPAPLSYAEQLVADSIDATQRFPNACALLLQGDSLLVAGDTGAAYMVWRDLGMTYKDAVPYLHRASLRRLNQPAVFRYGQVHQPWMK